MAKSRTSRARSSIKQDARETVPEVLLCEPLPPPSAPKAAVPVTTLSAFARRFPKSAVMRAFQDGERLAQAHTRKRSRAEWEADFDRFLKAPR